LATGGKVVGKKWKRYNMHPKINIKLKTLSHFKGELPRYQSPAASGFDVRAQLDKSIVLKPGERALIATALSFEIPVGYEIQARPRSGLAFKQGISIVNTPGTIDADYRGEVKIILINLGQEPVQIEDQERVAQLVLCPVLQAEFQVMEVLSATERGAGGFGSTGKT
jgi:dUTP pyrophosphatase